jgi:hypothetical protein
MARKPLALQRAAKKAEDAHRAAYPHLYETPDPSLASVAAEEPNGERGALGGEPPFVEDTPPAASEPSPPTGQEDYKAKFEEERQKFLTLQGKYNSEVPQMAYKIADLSRRIEDLTSKLTKAAEPPRQPIPPTQVITRALESNPKIKAFKDEFPDVFEGVSAVVNDVIAQSNQGIRDEITQVRKETKEEAERRFWREIDRDFPEWRKLNRDPEFLAWLDEAEPYSGITKQELLEKAHKECNAVEAVKFFKDFTKLKNPPPPPADPTKGKGQDALEQVGLPRGGKGPPAPPPAGMVTRADITKFYEDVRRGKWKGREAEKKKEEARLIAALRRQR